MWLRQILKSGPNMWYMRHPYFVPSKSKMRRNGWQRGMETWDTTPSDTVGHSFTVENIHGIVKPWILRKIDTDELNDLPESDKIIALNRLLMVHCFEVFLYFNCHSMKRCLFDCEIVLPALCSLIDRSIENGAKSFVIGLSLLTRLRLLSKLINRSAEKILIEMIECDDIDFEFETPPKDGKSAKSDFISLLGPPAEPWFVYPQLLGRVKALQALADDFKRNLVSSFRLIHQISATAEVEIWSVFCYPLSEINSSTFSQVIGMSNAPMYSVGGTIHVIINSESEEHKSPQFGRSSRLVKMFADTLNAPVVHVKAEEVDTVIYVMNLASDFRAGHSKDIVVDLIVPQQLSPHKNAAIAGFIREFPGGDRYSLATAYWRELLENKVICKAVYDEREEMCLKRLLRDQTRRKSEPKEEMPPFEREYKDPFTGSPPAVLHKLVQALISNPSNAPADISNLIEKRKIQFKEDRLDWEVCESLAYATLLHEGTNVHISRSKKGDKVDCLTVSKNVMKHFFPNMAEYEVCLSDILPSAMAGFEVGYSTVKGKTLNVWEVVDSLEPVALHGIIEQYLTQSDTNVQIGSIFIIPSYFSGPEKSDEFCCSCQPYKVLDMCKECEVLTSMTDQLKQCNMVVANVSTPANFHHLLKRQARTLNKKPLLIFVPNKYEKDPPSYSSLQSVTGESSFQPSIDDPDAQNKSSIQNVILCTGKVYFDLRAEMLRRNMDMAIVRLEQLYPFPYLGTAETLDKYSSATFWWAQEEVFEDGWWTYVEPRINRILTEENPVRYAGRYRRANWHYLMPKLTAEELRCMFDLIQCSL